MANNKILHVVPVGAVIPKDTVYYVEEADVIVGFQSGCDVIQQKDDKVRYTLNPLFVELPTQEGSVISVQGSGYSSKYFKVSNSTDLDVFSWVSAYLDSYTHNGLKKIVGGTFDILRIGI